ncbi:protein belonging to Uncharacterized protein family UPF0005 [gut metagenome]|uniref:Protein belonging to Uncharacterized protein family UPF0005 n=1 Tax=gut metagenome TaxID=749906 RepID=J9GFH7_9ZZZZ
MSVLNQNGYYGEPSQNQFYAAENRAGVFLYETLSSYTTKTFGWMFAGLGITFLTALAFYATGLAYLVASNRLLLIGVSIAELVVVFSMSARVRTLSVGGARGRFFAYAALNGVVFSSYFFLFDMFDLVLAFGATALYFGIMAGYGYVTKKDLCGWQKPLFFGLVAILIVSVIGMFFSGINILLTCAGIVLFACYTAYDTQKIKAAYYAYAGNEQLSKKASIFAALDLYLDFINMFLYILRLFARSNQDN